MRVRLIRQRTIRRHRLLKTLALVGLAFTVLHNLPDLARYLNMERM